MNNKKAPKRLAATAFLSTAILMVLIASSSVLGNKFPSSVLSPAGPEGAIGEISKVFLQGWGFFTRDAREDRISIAHASPNSDHWQLLDQDAIVQPKYLFGISRLSRAESIDINHIYAAISESPDWKECGIDEPLSSCLEPLLPSAVITISPIRSGPLCSDDIAIVRRTPIPYGYRDLTRKKRTYAIAITIRCEF